jgi:hypothetical protein
VEILRRYSNNAAALYEHSKRRYGSGTVIVWISALTALVVVDTALLVVIGLRLRPPASTQGIPKPTPSIIVGEPLRFAAKYVDGNAALFSGRNEVVVFAS